jgi:hypothetical protein
MTASLRSRGLNVLTAQEDGGMTLPDPELLDRVTAQGRILVTYDADFLALANQRLAQRVDFSTIVRVSAAFGVTSEIVDDIQLIAESIAADEAQNRVFYVPL